MMIRPSPAFTQSLCRGLRVGAGGVAAPAAPSALSRSSAQQLCRGYATKPGAQEKAQSNLPLILSGAGAAGLATYYLTFKKDQKAPLKAEAAPPALSKDQFIDFKLKEIKPYNHDSATFVFELPDGKSSGLSVASAVVVKGTGDGVKDKDGKPVIRPYTPVTEPETPGHIDFLIKKYPGGLMTEHIHSMKPGDTLSIKGPIPKFPYKANEFEHVGFLAGGSGITPMWQVMQAIYNNKDDKTKATLIFTNKTPDDILLKEEFEKLSKDPRFEILFGLDRKPKDFQGFEGYITPELILKHMPKPELKDKGKVFICGPPPMYKALSGPKGPKGSQGEIDGALKEAGYTIEQVYKF